MYKIGGSHFCLLKLLINTKVAYKYYTRTVIRNVKNNAQTKEQSLEKWFNIIITLCDAGGHIYKYNDKLDFVWNII